MVERIELRMQNLSNELEKAYEHCESITKTHAKSFYFAAKFLPPHKRRPIYALYALCRNVDDEVDEIGENNEAEAIKAIVKRNLGPQIFAFSRCMKEDVQRAIDTGVNGIVMEIPSSLHMVDIAYRWPMERG